MFKVLIKSITRQNAEWQAKFETESEALSWLAEQKLKVDRKDLRHVHFSPDNVPKEAISTEDILDKETGKIVSVKALMPAQATYEILDITEEEDLKAILNKRQVEYGTIGEQLDMIFHNGIEAWKSHIQQVKDNNPKPEEG